MSHLLQVAECLARYVRGCGTKGRRVVGGSAPLSIHKRKALLSWEARELLSGNQLHLTWAPPPLVNDLTLN